MSMSRDALTKEALSILLEKLSTYEARLFGTETKPYQGPEEPIDEAGHDVTLAKQDYSTSSRFLIYHINFRFNKESVIDRTLKIFVNGPYTDTEVNRRAVAGGLETLLKSETRLQIDVKAADYA